MSEYYSRRPPAASTTDVAAWVGLLAELKANRIDSPRAAECVRHLGGPGLLVRAWAHARKRELHAARDDVDAALQLSGDSAPALLIAGSIAALLREPRLALARWQAAVHREPRCAGIAVKLQLQLARRLSWFRELRDLAARGLEHAPQLSPTLHAELSQLFADAGLFDEARREAEAALPPSPSVQQQLDYARVAARAWHTDIAVEAVTAALEQAGNEADVILTAAEILIAIGAFERAQAILRELLVRDANNVRCWSRLAELQLWQGDHIAAEHSAQNALHHDPVCSPALRTRGICAFHRHDAAQALACFDNALAAVPNDAETLVWRARVRLLSDQPEEAHRDLGEASKLGGGFFLAAELLRSHDRLGWKLGFGHGDPSPGVRARIHCRGVRLWNQIRRRNRLSRQIVEPALAFLRLIRPDAGAILTSEDGTAQYALLRAGIAALEANYSPLTTLRRGGQLERVQVTFVREEARRALETIRVLTPTAARARLQDVMTRYPESSLPLCYMGELCLWLGEIAEAQHWLHRAIAHTRTTRWAYIGLAACELVQGHYEKTLEALAFGIKRMHDTVGPAVYPYRAEALRRLGRLDEARLDLQRAIETSPRRLSAWINLGLLEAARGDEGALGTAFERVRGWATGFMADAAAEIHEVAWLDGDALPGATVQRRLLEHMLLMMRGNRASGLVTYFCADGSLHVTARIGSDPNRFDASDLRASWSLIEAYSPAQRVQR